jgi:hypothetical protein
MFRASASSKYKLCPGSLALDEANPEEQNPLEANEVTAEGTLLHSAMDPANRSRFTNVPPTSPTDDRKFLTAEQLELLDSAREMEQTLIDSSAVKYGLNYPPDLDEREQEYRFRDGITTLFTGHPDRVLWWREKRTIIIPDYKFGYVDVPPAVTNLQLQSYVCMVAEEYEADRYIAAIIQPRATREHRIHSVCYELADVWPARQEIINIFRTARLPGAPRTPSPAACRYCIGLSKRLCLEARLTPSIMADLLTFQPFPKLDDMTPAQRCAVLDIGAVASDVVESYRDAAKELLKADPDAIQNWRLQSMGNTSTLDDVKGAYTRLTEAGYVKPQEFVDACKVSLDKLGKAIAASTSIKPSEAKALVKDRLKDLITETPKSPSLRRA